MNKVLKSLVVVAAISFSALGAENKCRLELMPVFMDGVSFIRPKFKDPSQALLASKFRTQDRSYVVQVQTKAGETTGLQDFIDHLDTGIFNEETGAVNPDSFESLEQLIELLSTSAPNSLPKLILTPKQLKIVNDHPKVQMIDIVGIEGGTIKNGNNGQPITSEQAIDQFKADDELSTLEKAASHFGLKVRKVNSLTEKLKEFLSKNELFFHPNFDHQKEGSKLVKMYEYGYVSLWTFLFRTQLEDIHGWLNKNGVNAEVQESADNATKAPWDIIKVRFEGPYHSIVKLLLGVNLAYMEVRPKLGFWVDDIGNNAIRLRALYPNARNLSHAEAAKIRNSSPDQSRSLMESLLNGDLLQNRIEVVIETDDHQLIHDKVDEKAFFELIKSRFVKSISYPLTTVEKLKAGFLRLFAR